MFTRLTDVVDKTRNFSMLYSGVEDEKNFNTLYDLGIRNFLMSYHYINDKNLDVDKYKDLGIKFLIDSGAFTYINNPKYHNRTIEEWEAHIERYLAWAKRHKDVIFAIASMDLEFLIEGEKVQEWNEKYFEPFMLETGIPVCFVWHGDKSKLSWEQYCQRYPYVGVSWGTDAYDDGSGGLKTGQKMLKVAEKYGAVVHGMAMTRTSLLTKLPFYTVDSTTWMVGVQYGEVNWWKGTKMSRLKKDKWKGEMLDEICNTLGRDRELLLAEDSTEMIRVNVQAFQKAEAYIQDRAKGKAYWLRPTKNANNVDEIDFPTLDWLEQDNQPTEEIIGYAKLFNINAELEDTTWILDTIIDVTCFLNWDNPIFEDFIEETYTPELIKTLHDTWINQVVASDEERVEDLVKFYTQIVEGKDDRLLVIGTNFDRIAKERDRYIEEETEEIVDVSPTELQNTIGHLLPEAPEIDKLDDEIFADNGLIAVRDDKGRFLKGQKKVRKPKNIYSEKYPKLVCNTCYASQNCPEFKEGYVCSYNKMFKRFDCRNTEDILEAMHGMVNMNMERMQRVAIFEMLDGGMPDGNLTMMIDQNMRLMMNMKNVMQQQEVVRQTRVVTADGTTTETTQVNSSQPGILERMFMADMGKNKEPNKEDIVEAVDVEVE